MRGYRSAADAVRGRYVRYKHSDDYISSPSNGKRAAEQSRLYRNSD